MDNDRLVRLERSVDALRDELERTRARLGRLESTLAARDREEAPPAGGEVEPSLEADIPPLAGDVPLVSDFPVARVASLTGQTCLILGGAFLLRALTDLEVLPLRLGLTLGLVYGLAWVIVAELSARRGHALGPNFYGAATAAITMPLVWEATTKFGVLAAPAAAGVIGAVTSLGLLICWRRDLQVLSWILTLPAVIVSVALAIATHQVEAYALVVLLLGGETMWLAYSREWLGLNWLVAAAADLLVLSLAFIASQPGGLPEAYQDLSIPAVLLISMALLLVYLGSSVVQTLMRKQEVSIFEMIQTGAALLVGLGGALQVARANDTAATLPGLVALGLALAGYSAAFAFRGLRWEQRRNFMFYSWLALVLTVTGSYLVASGVLLILGWCLFAVISALFGARFRRLTLYYHSAVYTTAAAAMTGLVATAVNVFAAPATIAWVPVTPSELLVLATAWIAYAALVMPRVDPDRRWNTRIPRIILATVTVLGSGAAFVWFSLRALGELPPGADGSLVAVIRSAVLAVAAILLAVLGRRERLLELRWLVPPLLVVGGIKLVIDDLRNGTAVTLCLAFALYGTALIVAPRLVLAAPRRREST